MPLGLGQRTIRQSVKKLTIFDNHGVVGVSGPIGLAERFAGENEELWMEKKLSGKKSFEAMSSIRESIWKHSAMEMNIARTAGQILGPSAAQSAVASAVVALPISK